MEADRIDQEIVIAASGQQVWQTLTGAVQIGTWFGVGEPAQIDLRPGGMLVFRHNYGPHGVLTAQLEKVEGPRIFSYYMLQTEAAPHDLGPGNSTLTEFTLRPDGPKTVLRVAETGFAGLSLPEEQWRARRDQNAAGLPPVLDNLRRLAEDGATP